MVDLFFNYFTLASKSNFCCMICAEEKFNSQKISFWVEFFILSTIFLTFNICKNIETKNNLKKSEES